MEITTEILNKIGSTSQTVKWFKKSFSSETASLKDVIVNMAKDGMMYNLSCLFQNLYGFIRDFDGDDFHGYLKSCLDAIDEYAQDNPIYDEYKIITNDENSFSAKLVNKAIHCNTDAYFSRVLSLAKDNRISTNGTAGQFGNKGDCNIISLNGFESHLANIGNLCNISSSGNNDVLLSNGISCEIALNNNSNKLLNMGAYSHISDNGSSNQIFNKSKSSRIGITGDFANVTSIGDAVSVGSVGNNSKIKSEGRNVTIVSGGATPEIEAIGDNAVLAVTDVDRFKVGNGGAVAVGYHDGERTRFAVGYVGENLKPDTWYRICITTGEFVEDFQDDE